MSDFEVTATDPRLGEIEAKLRRAESYGYPSFVISTADVAYLLAELRKRDEALWRVERLAVRWATLADGDRYYARHIRAALDEETRP